MTENEYSYETYTLNTVPIVQSCVVDSWGTDNDDNDDNEDKWDVDDIVDSWQPDYFTKIKTILDNPLFDKSLPYNIFVKIYDIEESLAKYVINNIVYYYNKFKIVINKDKITFGSLCLSNIPIDEKYSNYLTTCLDTIKFDKEDIELICLNIIDTKNLEMFKILENSFNIELLIDKPVYSYIGLNYNIVNHTLFKCSIITQYILSSYNFELYKYLYNHIDSNTYIHNLDFSLQNKIIDKLKDTEIHDIRRLIYLAKSYTKYDEFIETLVFKINKIDVYQVYITTCIENRKYKRLRTFVSNHSLIFQHLNNYDIFKILLNIFSDKISEAYSSEQDDVNILKIWNLLFPYIEKSDINLEYYFTNNNVLHTLVGFRKSFTIIKDIQPYVLSWEKIDYSYFTPLLDCIRYSSYNSVKYMIENLDLDLTYNSGEYNILTCAIHNSDVRVIKYISTLIKNNIELNNTFNTVSINDYIYALKQKKNSVFNKIKIKLNILIDILGIGIIDDIFNSFQYHKQIVKHLLTKHNYKITFDKIYLNNSINCNNSNNYNNDYLKLVIDNTLFDSPKFNYNNFIVYITQYNNNNIELIIDAFDYSFKNYNIKKVPFEKYSLELLIYNIYEPSNKNFNKEIFISYINYLRRNIVINDISDFNCIVKNDYNISKYINIVDTLFKNGFYFIEKYHLTIISENINNKLNNLYNYQILFNINNKKEMSDPLISNWCIVINVLKLFVRKRFKKHKKEFTHKLYDVNHEFKFKPTLMLNKFNKFNKITNCKPYHIMPLDCLKTLNETHLQITQKADGICKKGIFNIYPPEISQLKFNLSHIEYEFVKLENICYLFNYLDKTIDIYDIIIKLRSIHPYISNKIFPHLSLTNYKDVLLEYESDELMALTTFKTQNKFKKKWWAKYIFKVEHMSHSDYLNLLHGIKQLNIKCIPTDGWVLIDNEYNDLIKIKPSNHLTIDLLYENNRLVDNKNNNYIDSNSLLNGSLILNCKSMINGKIYRCYFNDETESWIPREIRHDKNKPNDAEICRNISLSHKYNWNINDLCSINLYYQKNNKLTKSTKSTKSTNSDNYKEFIKGNSILDLGCGFSNKFKKSILTKYVGLDIDPKVIVNIHNNGNPIKYMCDLTLGWSEQAQIKTYKNSYYHFPNIDDFKDKYSSTKFDTILSINNIHYLLEGNHNILFQNINNHSHDNSVFIVKCLDGFLTKSLLIKKKYITHGSSFIRRETKNQIKIYYEWCHNTPQLETLYETEELETIFSKYGWKLKEYKYEIFDPHLNDWEQYFKYFSVYVFSRVSNT
jgi:hypothetical protein